MGCSVSSSKVIVTPPVSGEQKEEEVDTANTTRDWKLLLSSIEARKKFIEDGTLSVNMEPGHLELRTLLDDPIALKALGEFAQQTSVVAVYSCWIDIQGYKSITSGGYRRSTALNIYHTYIADSSVLLNTEISDLDRLQYHANIKASKKTPSILQMNFYDKVQQACFESLYQQIFLPYKSTPLYVELCKHLKERYNHVTIDDFEYYSKLGEGGFGFVVHCKKKSTGKHYAMKIQRKKGLVDNYKTRPHKIDFEKQAFAICQHPFIVSMDYAFQTESLAIMVLELDTAGDLYYCLKQSTEQKLSNDRVCFYAAEIVLALSYMHSLGLIYRDLKPQNVLLSESGHIQLTDLGGVMDESGEVLESTETEDSIPLLVKEYGVTVSEKITPRSSASAKKKRALSVMGTLGYMAPEMMNMLNVYQKPKDGKKEHNYTYAVDWWSLGITMFKLLTDKLPFKEEDLEDYISPEFNKVSLHNPQDNPANIRFPSYIDKNARNLISRLLDANYETRLGSGEFGDENIKAHPYFASIDWNLLEQKLVPPPVKPKLTPTFQGVLVAHHNLREVLKENDKEKWLEERPDQTVQQHFQSWDFTSSHTIRVEAGLSHCMAQYSKNDKIKELMGKADANSYSNSNNIRSHNNSLIETSTSVVRPAELVK